MADIETDIDTRNREVNCLYISLEVGLHQKSLPLSYFTMLTTRLDLLEDLPNEKMEDETTRISKKFIFVKRRKIKKFKRTLLIPRIDHH
jgi:hypothetical protein